MVLTFPAGSLHRYNLAKQRQCYTTRADSSLGFFAFSRSLFAVQLLHIKFSEITVWAMLVLIY